MKIKYRLHFIASCLLLLYGCSLLSGCRKDTFRGQVLDLNAPVKITAFKVQQTEGSIEEKTATINIELPFGTDLSSVVPAVSISGGATVSPASGVGVDMKQPVKYRVSNGNIYSDYTVTATEKKALLKFEAAGITAEVDEQNRTVYAVVPNNIDITKIAPQITLATGASISPASGVVRDFSQPVVYTVTSGAFSVAYEVTIVPASAVASVAFLGSAATRNALVNQDELAAANWLFANFSNVTYVSFDAIRNNTLNIDQFKVIWWHHDAAQALPAIAYDVAVVNRLKAFRSNGGALLLSAYAGQYLDPLGVVPAGKGPNNVFGDNTPWLETNWDWGISFKGNTGHPIFQGLTLTGDKPYPTAYTLAKGTFRLNHSAIWKVNEWGGYGSTANWRSQTGGIDLASTEWDEDRGNHVTIAEFPRTAINGPVIAIVAGCYDWYNEPNPANGNPSAPNGFSANVERLTKNTIQYLSN